MNDLGTLSGWLSWAEWFGFIGVSSIVAVCLAHKIPWRQNFLRGPVPLAMGVAAAPFILGILTCAVLTVFSGWPTWQHRIILFGILVVGAMFLLVRFRADQLESKKQDEIPFSAAERVALICLLLTIGSVAVWTWLIPLLENDALEYGLVGREIYEAASLRVYPLVESAASVSGFTGPWTHPPLYPALIYLTYAVTGAGAGGVMSKSIGLWFFLGAIFATFGLARSHSRLAGLVAATILASTPLLASGASGGAIDPIPVAAIVLIIAAISSIRFEAKSSGIWIGLIIGMTLWSHSQAILYLPIIWISYLIINNLRIGWEEFATLLGATFLALAMTSYPYARNIDIYGSLISDMPAALTAKSLHWEDYIKFSRGLDGWGSVLQYGVLKGLFIPMSFGASFWLLGFACLWLGTRYMVVRHPKLDNILGYKSAFTAIRISKFSIGMLLVYFAGTVMSTLVGTDLMVKNDRYLLVMLPPLAIVGGIGFADFVAFSRSQWSIAKKSKYWIIFGKMWYGLFIIHGLIFLGVVNWYNLNRITLINQGQLTLVDVLQIKFMELMGSNESSKVEDINIRWRLKAEELSEDINILVRSNDLGGAEGLTFATRPADFFYSGRRMLSYISPESKLLYDAESVPQLRERISELGIRFIQVTNYLIPPISNSKLMLLLADRNLAILREDDDFNQLYEINSSSLKQEKSEYILGRHDLSDLLWLDRLEFGVQNLRWRIPSSMKLIYRFPYSGNSNIRLFAREISRTMESGVLDFSQVIIDNDDEEYLLDLEMSGEGYVKIWLSSEEVAGQRRRLLGDVVLSSSSPTMLFKRRFKVRGVGPRFRIFVERLGTTRLTLDRGEVVVLGRGRD